MYDHARRRRTKRKQRERGCWLYIAQEELAKAGFTSDEPAPFYKVWGSSRGGVFVRLYRKG